MLKIANFIILKLDDFKQTTNVSFRQWLILRLNLIFRRKWVWCFILIWVFVNSKHILPIGLSSRVSCWVVHFQTSETSNYTFFRRRVFSVINLVASTSKIYFLHQAKQVFEESFKTNLCEVVSRVIHLFCVEEKDFFYSIFEFVDVLYLTPLHLLNLLIFNDHKFYRII